MALELVCRAESSCTSLCGPGPGDLGAGSRGSDPAENGRKTGPTITGQTTFRYPVYSTSSGGLLRRLYTGKLVREQGPSNNKTLLMDGPATGNASVMGQVLLAWVPAGSRAGDFRAGFPAIFGRIRPPEAAYIAGPQPTHPFARKTNPPDQF